jgi:hypothetical protein
MAEPLLTFWHLKWIVQVLLQNGKCEGRAEMLQK